MSRTYNVGVIGTSWAARSPLPSFQTFPRTNLVAVCSARMERAQAAAEQFGAERAYDDYTAMVAADDIDIVYIGGPVYLHGPMVQAALDAGKHILCEKPLSLDAIEARRLLETAQARDLKHIVAFTMRFFPWSSTVKRLIGEGVLGEVRHVNIVQYFGFPIMPPPGGPPSAEDGRPGRPPSQGPAAGPPPTYSWLNDASLGGGMLGAMGSHYLDLLNDWLGGLDSVSGDLRTWRPTMPDGQGNEIPVTADDAFSVAGTLRNGGGLFTMQFSANTRAGTGSRIEIYGSLGTIVVDNGSQVRLARAWDRELQPVETPEIEWPADAAACAVPRFGLLIDLLLRAIEEPGFDPHPSLVDGLACQEALDAVREAARTGTRVAVRPV